MATTTLHFSIVLDEMSAEDFKILAEMHEGYAEGSRAPRDLARLAYSGGTAFLESPEEGGDPLAAAEILQRFLLQRAPQRTVTFQVGIVSTLAANDTSPGRFGGEIYRVTAQEVDVLTTDEMAGQMERGYDSIQTLYRDEAEGHGEAEEGTYPPIQVELRDTHQPEILIRDVGGLAIHLLSLDLFHGEIRAIHHDLRETDGSPTAIVVLGESSELERPHDEDDLSFIDRAA